MHYVVALREPVFEIKSFTRSNALYFPTRFPKLGIGERLTLN